MNLLYVFLPLACAVLQELHGTSHQLMFTNFQDQTFTRQTLVHTSLKQSYFVSNVSGYTDETVHWLVDKETTNNSAKFITKLNTTKRSLLLPPYKQFEKPSSLLVVVVGFRNENKKISWPSTYLKCSAADVPCMLSRARSLIWGKNGVNDALNVSSRGKFKFQSLSGVNKSAVVSVVIDQDISEPSCYFIDWGIFANDYLLARLNIDYITNYTYETFILPSQAGNGTCGWTGVAFIGCRPGYCMAWVRDVGTPGVFAHELGHLLGMKHASVDSNDDGRVDCEYCDSSCNMGKDVLNLKTYNAPHRLEMGWIDPKDIITGPLKGNVTLTPSSAILITRADVRYVISLRIASGLDASLKSNYVYIHRSSFTTQDTLLVKKMTSNSMYTSSQLRISTRSISPVSAMVNVYGDAVTCTGSTPKVSVSSSMGTVDKFTIYTCNATTAPLISVRALESTTTNCGASSVDISASCAANLNITVCRNVTLLVQSDNFPSEVRWWIGTRSQKLAYNTLDQPVTVQACGAIATNITFFISDRFGDGICCTYGYGSYIIWMDGSVLSRGGVYGYNDTVVFPLCPRVTAFKAATLNMFVKPGTEMPLNVFNRWGNLSATVRVASSCK